jgi:superfamily II DNA or RNA helicase
MVSIDLDEYDLSDRNLSDQFGSFQFGHGKYIHGLTSSSIELVEKTDIGSILIYSCFDESGFMPFRQHITISPSNLVGQKYIIGRCTCVESTNCIHVIAACLQLRESHVAKPTFKNWLNKYESIDKNPAPVIKREQEVHYILNEEIGAYSLDTIIYLKIVKRVRKGGWTKGRKITVTKIDSSYQNDYTSDIDREIVSLLMTCVSNPFEDGIRINDGLSKTALKLLIESDRLYWDIESRSGPLKTGEPRMAKISWELNNNYDYQIQLNKEESLKLLALNSLTYVDTESLEIGDFEPPTGMNAERLDMLQNAPPVSEEEAKEISQLLALNHPEIPTPLHIPILIKNDPLIISLGYKYIPLKSAIFMRLVYQYGDESFTDEDLNQSVTHENDGQLIRINRDIEAEKQAVKTLLNIGAENASNPGYFFIPLDTVNPQSIASAWFSFTDITVPKLEANGWKVFQLEGDPFNLVHADAIDAEVGETGNAWFKLRFDLMVNGEKVPLLPLISELIGNYQPGNLPEKLYLHVEGNDYVSVPREKIEPILKTIIDLYDQDNHKSEDLLIPGFDSPILLEMEDTPLKGAEALKKLAKKLKDFDGIKKVTIPSTFKGELRSYQHQGVNWLQFLREYDLAGILADDMGLGKTVQALAHLAIEKHSKRMTHPCLIVATTSLMSNWKRESQKFTPKLKTLVLQGQERSKHFDNIQNYDLVFTTYPLLARDSEILNENKWHYLILDEAQNIKNPKSQAARLVRTLQANHRLSLSGTPLENHLGELWAQFDFLLPHFLGNQKKFNNTYRTPIEKENNREKLQRLTKRISPFLLRRTKDVVEKDLPPKTEIIRTVPLEDNQAYLYESIRLSMEKRVRDAIQKKGLSKSHITVLDALLKLRQVCCDPQLVKNNNALIEDSGSAKLEMLFELLTSLLEENRRVLLFSQFTSMLEIIESRLNLLKIDYCKLTGQTKNREAVLDKFQNGEVDLFLISLKAGGTGLNLTGADTVIHYDPWWNPMVESQATDRAHRIGQDKPVFVYKLITEGTVEEKIIALQNKKKKLSGAILGDGKAEKDFSITEEVIKNLLEE